MNRQRNFIYFCLALCICGSPGMLMAEGLVRGETISPGLAGWYLATESGASGLDTEGIHPRPGEYVARVFLPHMWDDTRNGFFKARPLLYLGLGGLAAWAVYQGDDKINEYWHNHRMAFPLAEIGNVWGEGYLPAGLGLGMYTFGYLAKDQQTVTNAEVLIEALIIQGAVINIMKPIVGRERPLSQDNLSFPSGHAGCAFATAAVLQDRYGYKVGLPAYSLAVLTGLARMDVQMHWASDVVMGAAIGAVTGYAVSRFHDDYPYKHSWIKKAQVAPLVQGAFQDHGDIKWGMMVSVPVN